MNDGDSVPQGSFRVTVLISLILIAVTTIATWLVWRQISPEARVPMHWNARGEPDGYGSRNSLFIMPPTLLFLTALFWFLPRIEPRRNNLLRSSKAYKATWLAMLLFMSAIQGSILLAALGREVAMDRFMGVALGLLFVVIGNYLGKVRSNHFFGVRTPWTLSSEQSWNKTHRLSGWLFVGFGLAMILVAFTALSEFVLFWGVMAFVVVLLLVTTLYSYLVWKNDPNRQPWRRKSGTA